MFLVDVPHDFPCELIRPVWSYGSELGCEFLSDCVCLVVRFVVEEDWLIGRGVDVLAADLPDDAPELFCICGVVTAANVLDPGFS